MLYKFSIILNINFLILIQISAQISRDTNFTPSPVSPNPKESCIDFDNPLGIISDWHVWHVSNLSFVNQTGHGNYLNFKDASGVSWVYNYSPQFAGNWLNKGNGDCLCFDYKVNWNTTTPTNPIYSPNISLYNGSSPPNFNWRATFVGNSLTPPLVPNTWRRICLPIGLCQSGQLPSNLNGTWVISQFGGPNLTGSAACTAWNNLIQSVTGLALCSDYNSRPDEVCSFDNFCWRCETTYCCPGENLVKNGDFKFGNIDFISAYFYQNPTGSNSITPGMYSVLNSVIASTISGGWNLVDHSTCNSAGNFLIVNGSTGLNGPQIAWEQNITIKPNTQYRFCAWFKDLKQCDFNVYPNVEVQFSSATGTIGQVNNLINISSSGCSWQNITHTLQTGPGNTLNVKIWLDEGLSGDGNDLAIDDIALYEIPVMPSGFSQFSIALSGVTTTTFNITATPNTPLPPNNGCGHYWEVCEVDNTGTCLPGTTMSNPIWSGSSTNFPGYNGTSGSQPGKFAIGHKYKIKYVVWCECNLQAQSTFICTYNPNKKKLELTQL
jgi:hypothetical protein